MDITLDDVLTILDEHYNNVKALDALNQELFQLHMGDKETVSDWGVHLLRHLQILTASFPEGFPPDCIAKLKCDHFYSGLPKWLKAIVAYLKASTNEKMYSDYLQAAREAEKEEAMEPSCNWMAENQTKPKAMSFFPLQKLKGTQPVMTPAVQVAHLEEDVTDTEESAQSDNPNGIEGMTEEEGSSTGGEMLLPLQQPWTFYLQVPVGEGIQDSYPFKLKGGDSTREGSPDPSSQGSQAKGATGGDAQDIGHWAQTLVLNPDPFHQ